jgi:hypothetical protein
MLGSIQQGVSNMQFISNQDVEVLVAQKRQVAIDAHATAYGANKDYAIALNERWGFDWFALSHTDNSDEGKAVRKEKTLFFEGLKKNHSNPSKVWADVRDYGKENRYPTPVADTAGGAEAENAGKKEGEKGRNRSPELRNLEELKDLFKFNRKQENLSPKMKRVQLKIGEALQEMGVDLHMIAD